MLNETKFDIRLDHTLTAKDNLFGRFSYDQAFSFVPGGSPGLAEANAFGSNENLINHARNVGIGWSHVFAANTLNQATFGYDRIFNYITPRVTSPADPGSAAAFPTPIPAARHRYPTSRRLLQLQGVVSVEPPADIGQSAIAATLPSRVEPTSTPSKTISTCIRGKHDIHVGIDIRANQMNVGTEAFRIRLSAAWCHRKLHRSRRSTPAIPWPTC